MTGPVSVGRSLHDAHLAQALTRAANPIFIIDRGAAIIWCNDAYCRMTGKSHEVLLGTTPASLRSTREIAGFLMQLWNVVMAGETWIGELPEHTASGQIVNVEAVFTPLTDPTGKPAMFLVLEHDITKHKVTFERLWRLANHDRLTGLANRGQFASVLDHTIHHCRRTETQAAVLFIDLDGFKLANDTHGHDTGDLVLVEVARRLRETIRASDIAARFGGDEFACILTNLDSPEGVDTAAQKVVEAIGVPMSFDGREVSIGASVGVAVFPRDGETQDELLAAADRAMYAAKRAGKNGWRQAVLTLHDRDPSLA